jgi:hypothetical protein
MYEDKGVRIREKRNSLECEFEHIIVGVQGYLVFPGLYGCGRGVAQVLMVGAGPGALRLLPLCWDC